jgi:alpha-ribazole phosphatase
MTRSSSDSPPNGEAIQGFIGLLRHGESAGGNTYRGWTDDPLTATGWQQMWHSTTQLTRWDQVISSPLQRCARFAQAFANLHAIPFHEEPGLKEINFGQWEGCSADLIMERSPNDLYNFWRDPLNHTPAGGEPLLTFQARVLEAWERICQAYPGQRLLLVTHGGVIRILLSHMQQAPIDRLFEIEVRHASLFGLKMSGGSLQQLTTSTKSIAHYLA